MHRCLNQNVLIFPLYILLRKRINIFWSEGIDTFWSVSIGTVWYKKSRKVSELYQLFMHTFSMSNCEYYLCTIQTTYQPNFV